MRRSITKPIPEEHQGRCSWNVQVDGKTIGPVSSVVINNPKLGTLTYGWTAAGYDGWTFREEGGGGSVVLPWTILDGVLHVGVVRQVRPNQGGEVWNAPRGFLDPGEDRRMGAARELAEELGLRLDAEGVQLLPGEPGNPNSTFFETWATGDGVTFFAVEVPASILSCIEGAWAFRPGIIDVSPETVRSRTAETITHARFLPWWEAASIGDLFTNAAVARLLSRLRECGRNQIG